MRITPQTLRAAAWAALALSPAQAQYVIDNLSFGHKEGPLSPTLRGIPHWHHAGEGYHPEFLSDRVILTPPYPGNKRGALWADDPLNHVDWTAELSFRVSGIERGSGNLQLWYTKDSQKQEPTTSLYTSPKFDGLVILVDQYEGRGGSIRGFLNDGTIDFRSHHDVDTLSFGQCNYAYRNLGRLSVLKLSQTGGVFEVTVDGHPCFKTDKVKLPTGYYFGISAASAENPDSFEAHKFVVSTTNANTREEPNYQQHQQQAVHGQQQQYEQQRHQQNQQQHQQQQSQQQQQQNKASEPTISEIPQMLSDVLAGSIRSQADQFADLHNRIQIINHMVNLVHDTVERIEREQKEHFDQIMMRLTPVDDRTSAMMRNVEKVERISMEVQRDLESKDFKDMLNAVHNAIQDSHNALSSGMPLAMAHIVVGSQRPSIMAFLFVAVAVQIMITGAYMVYKKRRHGAPKKYL
ncbi:concanavalin A-like lectin/glucanase [Lindgomyces ingoldianus]|uniref:Concanavalin A-like lectin/glucanase n=1 Tax=Lindgomyces ingoldianus TaxID=673940 RepID=A0ACB6RGM2_9PLEO|nr:concanavalin A-like lectin/glucanase [Lindgomyces ingoldianus]KAF2477923.1 concanavalin A-like lectin/glucanase [Lindgomyces ingoldianus]